MTDQDDDLRRKRQKAILIFILFDMLVVLGVVAFFGWRFLSGGKPDGGSAGSEGGERFAFTEFYEAKDGDWVVQEPKTHVLKEMKYVSSDLELPQYLVRTLPPGTHIRIVSAQQRWKEVEALDGEKVLCRGWVDAHIIRKVNRYEPKR